MRIDWPRLHNPEADRWDYRVTLVSANVRVAHDKTHEPRIARTLFPDRETFRQEEAQRFALLLAHWDVQVVGVRPKP